MSSKAKESTKKATKAPAKTAAPTVGQTLQAARLERNLTLAQVERGTRVRGKYLTAIEADDFNSLPHDIYTRGFVQSYARFLDLDPAAITKRYAQQRGAEQVRLRHKTSSLSTPRFTLTPRVLTAIGGTTLALLVGGYLIFQLSALTAAPNLEVKNPGKDQVLYGSLITVSGHVAGGADVFVNSSPILVDGNGNFTDDIALQDGVNAIAVSAKNRLGKTTTVTRNILAHVPPVDPSSTLPTTAFDGVAVSVHVKDKATTVTVKIDGQQKFKGTMLPGTVQTFKGKTSVSITTSNGSTTSLSVTNATVASKDLGPIGKNDQPKADFRFDKDTQFQ